MVGAQARPPEPVVSDPSRRLLVMLRAGGGVDARAGARRRTWAAADLLTRLHAYGPLAGIKPRSFRDQARRLDATGRDRGLAADGPRAQVAARVRTVRDGRARTAPCTTTHHLNVIGDGGSLALNDWEYGGLSNPRYDLAATIACHELTRPSARRSHGPVTASTTARIGLRRAVALVPSRRSEQCSSGRSWREARRNCAGACDPRGRPS